MLQEDGVDQAIDLVQQGKLEQAKGCVRDPRAKGWRASHYCYILQGAIAIKSQAPRGGIALSAPCHSIGARRTELSKNV